MRTVRVKLRSEKDLKRFLKQFPRAKKQIERDESILKSYTPSVKETEKKLEAFYDHWWQMPEFKNGYTVPKFTITLKLPTKHFNNLVDLTGGGNNKVLSEDSRWTTTMWYPPNKKTNLTALYGYAKGPGKSYGPKYPIYVISKGRWESRYTSKRLDEAGVPYKIVVEPSEYEKYCEHIDRRKVIKLPSDFSKRGKGSIPVRNWVWKHSIKQGFKRHWVLDDNIEYFLRLNNNKRRKVQYVGALFAAAENFVDRYENVALAGFHLSCFVKGMTPCKPFILNTRIYSCILIQNDIPFKWRGKYNEDTDLSLRVLKKGYCTVLFHSMLMLKHTMRINGGNTDELYKDGRLEFAQSLKKQHPDVVDVVKKYGRWHHQVDYSSFKKNNHLILKGGVRKRKGTNNFNMVLKRYSKLKRSAKKRSQRRSVKQRSKRLSKKRSVRGGGRKRSRTRKSNNVRGGGGKKRSYTKKRSGRRKKKVK